VDVKRWETRAWGETKWANVVRIAKAKLKRAVVFKKENTSTLSVPY
jgi:hypothetical protein